MAKKRTPRTFNGRDLVQMFTSFVPGSHVKLGRDAAWMAQFRDVTGYDAIDVLYAMDGYRGRTPKDIRSFIRWCHRYDPLTNNDGEDTTYEEREIIVAERLSGLRAPVSVLVYFDLYGACKNASDIAALEQARKDIEAFVTPILGPRE